MNTNSIFNMSLSHSIFTKAGPEEGIVFFILELEIKTLRLRKLIKNHMTYKVTEQDLNPTLTSKANTLLS